MSTRKSFKVFGQAKTDLLVVTDRYPPNSIGGAEQSLHITLKRVNEVSDETIPKYYEYEGVNVIALPRNNFQSSSSSVTSAIILRLLGIIERQEDYFNTIFNNGLKFKKHDKIKNVK